MTDLYDLIPMETLAEIWDTAKWDTDDDAIFEAFCLAREKFDADPYDPTAIYEMAYLQGVDVGRSHRDSQDRGYE